MAVSKQVSDHGAQRIVPALPQLSEEGSRSSSSKRPERPRQIQALPGSQRRGGATSRTSRVRSAFAQAVELQGRRRPHQQRRIPSATFLASLPKMGQDSRR